MEGAAKRQQPEIQTPEENHPALNALLGANPFVGLDATQVLGTLATLLTHIASQPVTVASRALQLTLELGQIVVGQFRGGSRSGRQALRRSRLDAASALPSPDAVLPRVARRDARPRQRGRERRVEGRRAAEVRAHAADRGARAHQRVSAESRRAQARLRHLRDEPGVGAAQFHRRPVEQRRDAVDGGQAAVRSRQESRALARRGRVPQPALRGDSIRARDRQGLRAPAALHPAADQQVLHHGSRAGPQLRRVRGQARHPDVHDQLAQSDAARSRAGGSTNT